MGAISSIYGSKDSVVMRKPKPAREITVAQASRKAEQFAEKVRLIRLVRANGFPECSMNARMPALRQYLQEKGITP